MSYILFHFDNLKKLSIIMQAFLDLGELLISTDTGAALDAFKTVRAVYLLFLFIMNLSVIVNQSSIFAHEFVLE